MALSQSTLSSGIAAMSPTLTEADAIQSFVTAWDNYFAGSSVAGIAATPGSYAAGLAALQAGLTGLSTPNAGSTIIQAGLTAFWGAIAALPTAIWITAPIVLIPPIVPPVSLATLAPALDAVFLAATTGSLSLQDAADQIATVLHSSAGLGALVPGSIPPVPPAPLPIL